MTNEQIIATDIIIEQSSMLGVYPGEILKELIAIGRNVDDLKSAAIYLQQDEFIEIELDISKRKHMLYKLTPLGAEFQASGKSYNEFLVKKAEKAKKQAEKDDMEWRHRMLQIDELEFKIKELNVTQVKFWESGIERDKRQKWQFWLTFSMALIALILSIINLIFKV